MISGSEWVRIKRQCDPSVFLFGTYHMINREERRHLAVYRSKDNLYSLGPIPRVRQ